MVILSSYCGKPDGLSFLNTSVPVDPAGWGGNVSTTIKGTKSSVIQSDCAWAMAVVMRTLFWSRSSIGNDASKYQNPRALPVIVNGLVICWPTTGEKTSISGDVGWTISGGVGSSTLLSWVRCVHKNATITMIKAIILTQEIVRFIKYF